MDTPPRTGSSLPDARAWLAQGHRRLYAVAGALLLVILVLVSTLPSGGAVSLGRMQQLIDTAYETSGTHCAPAPHGRDLCRLKAEKCRGTLLVAPTSGGHFTIVSSSPDQLDSSACDKHEGGVAGFE